MPLAPELTEFTTTSPLLVNYDWIDVEEGIGYVTYYGTNISIDATPANNKYILVKNVITPSEENTISTGGPSIDFDITFNIPKDIKGNLLVSLPILAGSGGTTTTKITPIHYDGSTETILVAQVTNESVVGSGSDVYEDRITKITIPKTHFAAGDTFRLTIDLSAVTAAGYLWHDPTGSRVNFTKSGGAMRVYIPYSLNR